MMRMPKLSHVHIGAGIVGVVAAVLVIVGAVKLEEAKKTKRDESEPRLMITGGVFCAAGALGIWHHAKVSALVHRLMGHNGVAHDRAAFQARVASAAARLRSSIELAQGSSLEAPSASCAMSGGDSPSASALAAQASARISSFLAQQM
jgi:hypothetical protein